VLSIYGLLLSFPFLSSVLYTATGFLTRSNDVNRNVI